MLLQFKLGMAQMYVEGGDLTRNLERAKEMIQEASKQECGIVVLPECLDIGWIHPSAKKLARKIETSFEIDALVSRSGVKSLIVNEIQAA